MKSWVCSKCAKGKEVLTIGLLGPTRCMSCGVSIGPGAANRVDMSDWEALKSWAKLLDSRDISDEARRWASEDEWVAEIRDPLLRGDVRASLEIAFEAGRKFSQRHD